MAPFLDTNIFVRHLANDDPQRSTACLALIQAIEQGRIEAWTSDMVIAEIVYVLSSKRAYNLDRETIRDLLLPIINLPGIKLPSKRLYQRVFELYVSLPIDYVDAYHAGMKIAPGGTGLWPVRTGGTPVPLLRERIFMLGGAPTGMGNCVDGESKAERSV